MRKIKKIFYVCVGIVDDKLCSMQTEALNRADAIFNFIGKFHASPDDVYGPFSERRESSKRKLKNIRFSTTSYSAKYKGWYVTVNELTHPNNYAYVMYDIPIENAEKPKEEIVHIRYIQREGYE